MLSIFISIRGLEEASRDSYNQKQKGSLVRCTTNKEQGGRGEPMKKFGICQGTAEILGKAWGC